MLSDKLHLFPIVWKFFSAIQADYVRTRHLRGRRTTRTASREWEAIVSVPATEEHIDQTHRTPLENYGKEAFVEKSLTIQLLSSQH